MERYCPDDISMAKYSWCFDGSMHPRQHLSYRSTYNKYFLVVLETRLIISRASMNRTKHATNLLAYNQNISKSEMNLEAEFFKSVNIIFGRTNRKDRLLDDKNDVNLDIFLSFLKIPKTDILHLHAINHDVFTRGFRPERFSSKSLDKGIEICPIAELTICMSTHQYSVVNPRQIKNWLFVSLNTNTLFGVKDCMSGIEIDISTTHPNTSPNTERIIACIKVLHCKVSDSKTNE